MLRLQQKNLARYDPVGMITLQVKRNVKLTIDQSILLRAAEFTLQFAQRNDHSDLTIVIGNDELIHQLNLKYRQVNTPTDVLSFPSGEIDPDTSRVYLGDVIISLPRAEEQAFTQGHSVAEEFQLLVVHGILHLLGYDHVKATDKKQMQDIQDKIMSQLGINLSVQL
jgi:probable rRNA maturation factor